MRIAVAGCGHVGLVTGACLADAGNRVICFDLNAVLVAHLKSGKLPLYEPGLEELVARTSSRGDLLFTFQPAEAFSGADVIFLAVPTPGLPGGGCDLKYLHQAMADLAPYLERDAIVAVRSTVPVGEGERLEAELRQFNAQWRGSVVSNPEFLKEGDALDDFLRPDRVVIGAENDSAFSKLAELYEPFVRTGSPVMRVSRRSAEMGKYAANLALAARISMMNEMAALTEKAGANIDDVRRIVGSDSRIGARYLFAGAGFGGSCLPKDARSLVEQGSAAGLEMYFTRAVLEVNERQTRKMLEKLEALAARPLKEARVALWGLSFKPETDDLREAPALLLARTALEKGARVRAYDPKAAGSARGALPKGLELAPGPYEVCEGAHVLAVMTEWNLFRRPDFARIHKLMAHPAILDARNLYSPPRVREAGFAYDCVGAR